MKIHCLSSLKAKILKVEISFHLKEKIVEWKLNKAGGSRNVTYIGVTASGKKVLAKYTLFTLNILRQRKIRRTIDAKITFGFPKLIKSYLSVFFLYCFVNEWLDGQPLDLNELNNDPQQLKDCAEKVCHLIKELHTLDLDTNTGTQRSLKKDYKHALSAIKHYKIAVPHYDSFVKYVDDNIEMVQTVRRSFVHFDFYPGNVISNNGEYKIIDLETVCISDPWRDLVYAIEINFPEQRNFWRLLLLNYFGGTIPSEFYSVSKLYVIVYMLMIAKYNRDNLDTYFLLVNKVYDDYDNLNAEIPKWLGDINFE